MIDTPACISNVFSVGALANNSELLVANYSNNSRDMDILAPGAGVYSALYVPEPNSDSTCDGSNCYKNWMVLQWHLLLLRVHLQS